MKIITNQYFILLAVLVLAASQISCKVILKDEPATAEPTPTQIVESTPTQMEQLVESVETQEPTEAPILEPTFVEETLEISLAEELPEEVLDYYSGTSTSYTTVVDFDEKWAQIGWYQYWKIEDSPTNFVIRTDATWSSASNTANWHQSGCGFVFHITDNKNHFVAYLGLDGHVYIQRVYQGKSNIVGSSYFGKVDVPEGNAELMLMVYGDRMYFFVNSKQVYKGNDTLLTGKLNSGDLNKDFGTRCQMTSTELWDLGKP